MHEHSESLESGRLNHEQIEAVAAVFRDAPTLTEIELRGGSGISVRLRRPAPRKKATAHAAEAAVSSRTASSNGADTGRTASAGIPPSEALVPVTAGVVGVFRALEGAAAVSVGASVKAGQVLGHIEAIRLMNDCVAPSAGTLRGIHVHSGQPVEYGQILFEIGSAAAEAV